MFIQVKDARQTKYLIIQYKCSEKQNAGWAKKNKEALSITQTGAFKYKNASTMKSQKTLCKNVNQQVHHGKALGINNTSASLLQKNTNSSIWSIIKCILKHM